LRLYKVGDISFIRQAIMQPGGRTVLQLPYRAMNDLNSYSRSSLQFELEFGECELWNAFAKSVRESRSWNSDWFSVARQVFLHGGANPFNPEINDVDRIVDYATALEATLVFESDFNTRRISRRAGKLVAPGDATEEESITDLIKKSYGMRSGIVHGSKLSTKDKEWLIQNCLKVEHRVRQVLRTAVQTLPANEAERRAALVQIYDLTDDDRGAEALDKFKKIKTPEVKERIAVEILKLLRLGAFRLLRIFWRAAFTRSRAN
jgi:hypothetical protein